MTACHLIWLVRTTKIMYDSKRGLITKILNVTQVASGPIAHVMVFKIQNKYEGGASIPGYGISIATWMEMMGMMHKAAA